MKFDMTLAIAIAHSAGNKAKTTRRDGAIIIVQQRYQEEWFNWLHVWIIKGDDVQETDMRDTEKLLSIYDVHPDMPIWTAL